MCSVKCVGARVFGNRAAVLRKLVSFQWFGDITTQRGVRSVTKIPVVWKWHCVSSSLYSGESRLKVGHRTPRTITCIARAQNRYNNTRPKRNWVLWAGPPFVTSGAHRFFRRNHLIRSVWIGQEDMARLFLTAAAVLIVSAALTSAASVARMPKKDDPRDCGDTKFEGTLTVFNATLSFSKIDLSPASFQSLPTSAKTEIAFPPSHTILSPQEVGSLALPPPPRPRPATTGGPASAS